MSHDNGWRTRTATADNRYGRKPMMDNNEQTETNTESGTGRLTKRRPFLRTPRLPPRHPSLAETAAVSSVVQSQTRYSSPSARDCRPSLVHMYNGCLRWLFACAIRCHGIHWNHFGVFCLKMFGVKNVGLFTDCPVGATCRLAVEMPVPRAGRRHGARCPGQSWSGSGRRFPSASAE